MDELFKNVLRACLCNNLTNYLRTVSTENLKQLYNKIIFDDIVGIKVNIFDCVIQELEYRNSIKILSKKVKNYKKS